MFRLLGPLVVLLIYYRHDSIAIPLLSGLSRKSVNWQHKNAYEFAHYSSSSVRRQKSCYVNRDQLRCSRCGNLHSGASSSGGSSSGSCRRGCQSPPPSMRSLFMLGGKQDRVFNVVSGEVNITSTIARAMHVTLTPNSLGATHVHSSPDRRRSEREQSSDASGGFLCAHRRRILCPWPTDTAAWTFVISTFLTDFRASMCILHAADSDFDSTSGHICYSSYPLFTNVIRSWPSQNWVSREQTEGYRLGKTIRLLTSHAIRISTCFVWWWCCFDWIIHLFHLCVCDCLRTTTTTTTMPRCNKLLKKILCYRLEGHFNSEIWNVKNLSFRFRFYVSRRSCCMTCRKSSDNSARNYASLPFPPRGRWGDPGCRCCVLCACRSTNVESRVQIFF